MANLPGNVEHCQGGQPEESRNIGTRRDLQFPGKSGKSRFLIRHGGFGMTAHGGNDVSGKFYG